MGAVTVSYFGSSKKLPKKDRSKEEVNASGNKMNEARNTSPTSLTLREKRIYGPKPVYPPTLDGPKGKSFPPKIAKHHI